ncbi:MAG: hypothetical protein WD052_11695 [Bacteroidales bacterium]
MKKFAKIKFWSFLVFGFGFLLLGAYLFVSGKGSPGMVKAMIIVGAGQLIIFYVLLFTLYREKLKEKFKK